MPVTASEKVEEAPWSKERGDLEGRCTGKIKGETKNGRQPTRSLLGERERSQLNLEIVKEGE